MVFFISCASISFASCLAAASLPASSFSAFAASSNAAVAVNIDVVTMPARSGTLSTARTTRKPISSHAERVCYEAPLSGLFSTLINKYHIISFVPMNMESKMRAAMMANTTKKTIAKYG